MTNSLEPNDLSHLSDEQFYALCPQGEHAPGPEPLSPAARRAAALMDVVHDRLNMLDFSIAEKLAIATALRAAADQGENLYDPYEGKVAVVRVEQLLAIAAELENGNQ